MDKWKSTSIDSQKIEIEQLQDQIENMKKDHQDQLAKKAQEFERWISQKEKAIEEEQEQKDKVEEKLEAAKVQIADLEKQLEQKDSKISNLEGMLCEESNKVTEITEEKKELEKKLATQEVLGKELSELDTYIEKIKNERNDAKSKLEAKTEELDKETEEKEKAVRDSEKQINKLTKQTETLRSRVDKLNEEKKEKMALVKSLTKENSELKKEIDAKAKKEELQSSKIAKTKEEDALHESIVKSLETQRDSLLATLERLQKTMTNFEPVISNKNERIQELSTKLEESEINLEQALEKINTAKSDDKEKKESAKTIKQLQSTLKEWESRQFSNLKLITGLEKEKADLKQQLKQYEDKVIGTDSGQLHQLSSKLKKVEKDIKTQRDAKDKAEQELAKKEAMLTSKAIEIGAMKIKIARFESRTKELEKELRLAGGGVDTMSRIHDFTADNEDVEGLKKALESLSERYADLKEENRRLKSEPGGNVKDLNEDKQNSQIKQLQKTLRDVQSKCYQQSKEIDRLREEYCVITHVSSSSRNQQSPTKVAAIKEEPIEVDAASSRQIILDIDDVVDRQSSTDSLNEEVDVEDVESSFQYSSISSPSIITNGSSTSKSSINTSSTTTKKSSTTTITLSSSSSSSSKKKSSKLVDVTDEYNEEEENITCGICDSWDPPLISTETTGDNAKGKKNTYTTSWVGCDCGQWYHKQCTNKKRFTATFSCKSSEFFFFFCLLDAFMIFFSGKSVKRKCQKANVAPPSSSSSENAVITDHDDTSSLQDIYSFPDTDQGELIIP